MVWLNDPKLDEASPPWKRQREADAPQRGEKLHQEADAYCRVVCIIYLLEMFLELFSDLLYVLNYLGLNW